MPCLNPLTAWREPSTGQVTFSRLVGDPDTEFKVPCKKCELCISDKTREWTTRLLHEARYHPASCCMTLTYDDQHLPPGGNLCERDVQLFIDRLRKYLVRQFGIRVRYFYAAEYGTDNGRPHYHLILFGFAFAPDRKQVSFKVDRPKYKSETLDRLWGNGIADIAPLTPAAARYVAKYLLKDLRSELRTVKSADGVAVPQEFYLLEPVYAPARWVTVKPFHRQSTSPGIGYKYFVDHMSQLISQDSIVLSRGDSPMPVPHYYDMKLGQVEPDTLQYLKEVRINRMLDNPPDMERLQARAEIMRLKQATKEKRR